MTEPNRKTIVFGNGIGMAVDHVAFNLANALDNAWNNPAILDGAQRDLIRQCLPESHEDARPTGEDDLDLLQQVLAACDFLRRVGRRKDVNWLTSEGQDFPRAIRRFIHGVACSFHDVEGALPDDFISNLCAFLHNTKSHIATLNYDNLLYYPLVQRKVLSGYKGNLIDGFWRRDGFSADHLDRKGDHRFGWYLHLHGSPLFYTEEKSIRKMSQAELSLRGPIDSTHLVLTHFKHKPSVISASRLLSAYWDYFSLALNESQEIILFGYSGYDAHLNEKVASLAGGKTIRVVEYRGSGEYGDRIGF